MPVLDKMPIFCAAHSNFGYDEYKTRYPIEEDEEGEKIEMKIHIAAGFFYCIFNRNSHAAHFAGTATTVNKAY